VRALLRRVDKQSFGYIIAVPDEFLLVRKICSKVVIESQKLEIYANRCQALAAKVWLYPGTEQLPSIARNNEESTALFSFRRR
jgi:hypothetical protein